MSIFIKTMSTTNLLQQLGNIDIYLLDQLMRGRIHSSMKLLDAGCGHGRNSEYFIRNNYDISGFDRKEASLNDLKANIPIWNPDFNSSKFKLGNIENPPFSDQRFDFIISSAVLHFAESRKHFIQLFEAMIQLLSPQGILWIRMCAKHTIESYAEQIEEDIYFLPDESTRYLLDLKVLAQLQQKHHLQLLDPFKTLNVSNLRTMSTIVLQK